MRASEFLSDLVGRLESVDPEYALVGSVEESQIRRRLRRLILPGVEAWCSRPEELIVKKLSDYHQGASDKHLRDIASMLRISPRWIDLAKVRGMAGEELGPILDRVLEAAGND